MPGFIIDPATDLGIDRVWLGVMLLSLALIILLIYMTARLHMLDKFWSSVFPPREGGTVVIVGMGTFGARQALRVTTAFQAAEASDEVLAVILADFHQEVEGYAKTVSDLIGKSRVITPESLPEGAGQGFMHELEHDWRTQDIWKAEVEDMINKVLELDTANGGTITTIFYILPPWSGHFAVASWMVRRLGEAFPKPILHIGHLNRPSASEGELRSSMEQQLDYPMSLGLDAILVSDEDKDFFREVHDWTIAAGFAGLFTANRVDPGQQHGANPIHALVQASRASRGLIGVGVGQGTVPVVPRLFGKWVLPYQWAWSLPRFLARRDMSQRRLSGHVAAVMKQALQHKAWDDAPDPQAGEIQFLSVVAPLHRANPQWRIGGTRRRDSLRIDAIKYFPDNRLPDGCGVLWSSAPIDNGSHERAAMIFALHLYPISDATVRIVPAQPHSNGHIPQGEPEPEVHEQGNGRTQTRRQRPVATT